MQAANLWGEIPTKGTIRTPASILREQATLLGTATNNILVGDVVTSSEVNYDFATTLYVIAPALDAYKFALLKVSHNVTSLYPMVIRDLADRRDYRCEDEETFMRALESILSSETTHRVLESLLSQSQAA